MSPEQSVLCSVSSHFAERDIVQSGDALRRSWAGALAPALPNRHQVELLVVQLRVRPDSNVAPQ